MPKFNLASGYSVETEDEGKIVAIFDRNGKPVKKSYLNAVVKAQETGLFRWKGGSDYTQEIRGMMSTATVDSFQAAIVRAVTSWMRLYEQGGAFGAKKLPFPVSTFDNLRYFGISMNDDLEGVIGH